jgi:hypothetical protein
MDNTTIQYSTQKIDPNLLSVLDITQEGKIVSAQNWTDLWALVFKHINAIDEYCLTIDALRINWEESKAELDAKIMDFKVKYNALKESFIHYGEQPPENEHIRLWIQPLNNLNARFLVTQQMLKEGLNTKVDKFPLLYNNPELVLYQSSLKSSSDYIVEQRLVAEDITNLQFILPGNRFSATVSWQYVIPAGANITIVYSRAASIGQTYAARVVIYSDTPWIVKTGLLGVPYVASACSGYYAIDYEITQSNGITSINSDIVHKFYNVADVTIARTTTVNLNGAAWSNTQPYSQVLNLPNITANSKIDLTPTPTQLNTFFTKGYSFIIENKNKVVTAYCIGNKPTEDYTITAAITEVTK